MKKKKKKNKDLKKRPELQPLLALVNLYNKNGVKNERNRIKK